MENPRIMESLSEGRKDRLSLHRLEQRRTEIQAFEVAMAEAIRLASGLNVLPALIGLQPKRGRMFHVESLPRASKGRVARVHGRAR